MTLPGSPSMPSMNGADRPSSVKAPATYRGSPEATYAAISASLGSPKRTVVDAVADTRRPPAAVSITQWPVRRTPERPRIDFQRAVASSASAGLPSARPSSSSTESQPTTRAPAVSGRAATAAAFASASTRASSAGESAVIASSSTPLTTTSGASPAWRSRPRRAGDWEARTRRRAAGPG